MAMADANGLPIGCRKESAKYAEVKLAGSSYHLLLGQTSLQDQTYCG